MWLDFDPNLTFAILIFFCYYLFTFLCCTLKNLFSSLLILPHEMASPVVLNVLKPSGFGGLRPLDPHRGIAPGPHQGPLSGPLDPRLQMGESYTHYGHFASQRGFFLKALITPLSDYNLIIAIPDHQLSYVKAIKNNL